MSSVEKEEFLGNLKLLIDDAYENEVITEAIAKIYDDNFLVAVIIQFQSCITYNIVSRLSLIIDDNIKIVLINRLSFLQAKRSVVLSLSSDELKMRYLNLFDNDKSLALFLKSIHDQSLRYDLLDKFRSEFNKVNFIIENLSDEEKMSFLNEGFVNIENRDKIIKSIGNDELRREAVGIFYKIYAIEGFTSPSLLESYNIFDFGVDALPNDLTFGTEIELEGRRSKSILLCGGKLFGSYDIREEESLVYGVELVSGKMTFETAHLKSIYDVCNFAKQNGLIVTDNCGLHFHFGIHPYLETLDSWLWLFYFFSNCERIMYFMTNRVGVIPRTNIMYYARPYGEMFESLLEEIKNCKSSEEFISLIQKNSVIKLESINLDNIGKRFDTVEFRIANGENYASEIIKTGFLFGRLIMLAYNFSRLPFTKDLYELLINFDRCDNLDQKADIFLSLLFKDEESKSIFKQRFVENRRLYIDKNVNDYLPKENFRIRLSQTGNIV